MINMRSLLIFIITLHRKDSQLPPSHRFHRVQLSSLSLLPQLSTLLFNNLIHLYSYSHTFQSLMPDRRYFSSMSTKKGILMIKTIEHLLIESFQECHLSLHLSPQQKQLFFNDPNCNLTNIPFITVFRKRLLHFVQLTCQYFHLLLIDTF